MDDAFLFSAAADRGLTRQQLRGARWSRPTHGVYAERGVADDLVRLCHALRLVLPPGAAFSHLTAARLLDLWVPRVPPWLPVQATLPPAATRPDRAGLWVARSRAGEPDPVRAYDLPLTPVSVLVGQLAEDLALLDLVVVVDCVLQRKLCTERDISIAIRKRQRGAPRLRRALELCDGRSESPWETVLRLLYVLCGLTDVEPQHVVTAPDGAFVARGDLWLVGTPQLSEYDGAQHRDAEQHAADLKREKDLARAGYVRYGYVKAEIVQQPGRILRDAETAFGLPVDPGRVQDWWPIFGDSTLSPEGWRRWLRRLRRFEHRRRPRSNTAA